MDHLVYFGDTVKTLGVSNGKGKVGGYLVRFSDRTKRDLSGEYFLADSYYGPKDGDGAEALFDHSIPIDLSGKNVSSKEAEIVKKLADHTFEPLKTKKDAIGIWAETVLDMADDYEKRVYEMVGKNKLGWSSGAPAHRVRKNADGAILQWPIAEGSLTPCPCEPQNRAYTMKSVSSVERVSLLDDVTKAVWSTAFVNDLPDSSFAFIESGGEKDEEGKTKPRTLRHFPYKDADGKADAAHVRNALARIPQSTLPDLSKKKALSKIKAAAKELSITVSDPGKTLASRLTTHIDDLIEDGRNRDEIIKRVAREGIMSGEDFERILSGEHRRPSNAKLKAISRALDLSFDQLVALADGKHQGVRSIKGVFDDAVAEEMSEEPCAYRLWSILSDVVKDIAMIACASQTTGTEFDLEGKITEAVDEYAARLKPSILAQIQDWMMGDDKMDQYDPEAFYLRALTRLNQASLREVSKGIHVDDHISVVVTALEDLVARFEAHQKARQTKAGRMLSSKTITRMKAFIEKAKAAVTDCEQLIADAMPKASDEAMRAAKTRLKRLQFSLHQIGDSNGQNASAATN